MDHFITKYDIDCPQGAERAVLEDSIMHKGYPVTAGSAMLCNFVAPFDATVVTRLEAAGITIVGKARMDEFGAAGLFANSEFGIRNSEFTMAASVVKPPFATASPTLVAANLRAKSHNEFFHAFSGAVAAVAEGYADFGLCNDYTGSVRRQAAACGLYYIRPTYGSVSRYGLVQAVPSMDQIGIVCKTPSDGWRILSIISGHDPKDGARGAHGAREARNSECKMQNAELIGTGDIDRTSAEMETETLDQDEQAAREKDKRSDNSEFRIPNSEFSPDSVFRIGVPTNVFSRIPGGFIGVGFGGNVEIVEFELKYFDIYAQIMQILCFAELSNNITRYDGVKFGYRAENFNSLHELYTKSRTEAFGTAAKLAAIMGAMVLSQDNYWRYYDKAMRIRRMIKDSLDFSKYDVIAMPAPLAEQDAGIAYGALPQLCGLPSITIPLAGDVGLSLIADQNREDNCSEGIRASAF